MIKYQMIDPLQIQIYPPLDHLNDDPIKYRTKMCQLIWRII